MANVSEDKIIPLQNLNVVQRALLKITGLDKWVYGRGIRKVGGDDGETLRREQMSLLMGEFSAYTQLSNDRHVKYSDYDAMDEGSPEVAAVLSLYAQEATPEDPRTRKVVWINSTEKEIEKKLTRLIREIGVEERAWGTIRNLAKYGDTFLLNLFSEGKKNTNHEEGKNYLRSLQYIYPGRVKRIEADTLLGFISEDLTGIIQPEDEEHNMYAPWTFTHGRLMAYDQESIYGRCLSSDTETLTRRGWVLLKDVKLDDFIATRSPNTKQFEWQRPTELIAQPYIGPMCRFKSQSLDLLVTPNHRMLLTERPRTACADEKYSEGEVIVRASELLKGYNDKIKIPMTSRWAGKKIGEKRFAIHSKKRITIHRLQKLADGTTREVAFDRSIPIPQPVIMTGDDYSRLMGAYLSEGNIRVQGGIEINQKSGSPGYGPYGQLLARISGGPAQHNGKAFILPRRAITSHFRQFGHSHEKFIPDEIMEATPKQIQAFLQFYIMGDGDIGPYRNQSGRGHKQPPVSITTVSHKMAGQLVELIQKIGWSASVSTFPPTNHTITENGKARIITGKHPQYKITVRYSQAMGFNLMTEPYDGTVYCVTVPNSVFYVRRNGKPAWTGNSMCEEVRKIWKMLSILETMVALAHVQRAVDRNIFMIDVGNASEEEGLALVKKFKQWLRRKEFFDPQTNQFKNDFNPTTIQEDLFLPTRKDSATKVDTLQGKVPPQGLVDDLNYFRNKLCAGLGVPREYLDGVHTGGVFDSKAALILQDIHFARKIERVQRGFRQMIHRICQVSLALEGIVTNDFEVKMASLNAITDRTNEELWERKAQVLSTLARLAQEMGWPQDIWNAYLTKNFIRDLPADVLKELLAGIKKMVPPEGFPTATPGGDGDDKASPGSAAKPDPKNPLSSPPFKQSPRELPAGTAKLFSDAFGKDALDGLHEAVADTFGETETLERLKSELNKIKHVIEKEYPQLENLAKAATKEIEESSSEEEE